MFSLNGASQVNGTDKSAETIACSDINGSEQQSKDNTADIIEPPSLPPLSTVTRKLYDQITAFLDEQHDPSSILYRVQQQTRISLDIIHESLTRYSLRELSISYNGGKDCLVLLLLFLASLHTHCTSTSPSCASSVDSNSQSNTPPSHPTYIPAIYAQPKHPFPSVEQFVTQSSRVYHLKLTRHSTDPPHSTIRSTFAAYLSSNPQVRAIFVGTRRTDPHGGKLTHFDRTDHGWPDFMRIHPVIDWHYVEIWAFIKHLGVEYCPLYDQGYTSLGGTNDTHPNPKLRVESDGENGATYRPAYELIEDEEERLGRD
ncbi:3'-phosphoadenosine 5'-phosphosulfate sulfotransferase [Microsporum audouinii]